MRTPKRERSRDKEEQYEKRFFPHSEKAYSKYHIESKSNSSSGSGSLGFQISKDDEGINIKYEKVKSISDFKKKLNLIEAPCSLNNVDILNKIKTAENNYTIPLNMFEGIKEENIVFLNNKNTIDKYFSSGIENKIIFSSNIFPNINRKNTEELNNFKKIHNYLTSFFYKSKITDFCLYKNLYFPHCFNDEYYSIERFFTSNFRSHHKLDGEYWKIDYHFGVSGGGKSIASRAIIHNYMHFKPVSGQDVFYPTIFFDIKLINSLINDKTNLLKILKYETMGLFRDFSDWKKYSEQIEEIIKKYYYTFDIIYQILNDIYNNKTIEKALIVIDHYSEHFDPNNQYLNKIKKFISTTETKQNGKFYFYVIFSILNQKDQEYFFSWFKSNINFPEIERRSDLDNKEAGVYHKYELKNIDQIKDIVTDIPQDYEIYFDKNISYYFRYKDYKGSGFENYIEEEKIIIKNDLNSYFGTIENTNNIKTLIKIKDYLNRSEDKKEMSFNEDLYKFFPSSYFIFYKNEKNDTYSITPAFPLVETILDELYEDFNENNFINIRSEEFKNLEGGPKGTIFDIYMNIWLRTKARIKLFQYTGKDIEVIKIKSAIKKNRPNWTIEDFYHESEVNKEINKNKYLKDIKAKYNKMNIDKKCIIVFQPFGAKSIDVYFLIKENDSYIINSIQMKCSNDYDINEKLLEKNRYEMTYIRNKFQILFGIKISASYITYLTIKEDPKECAINNESMFFYYSTELDKFVDINNNEINSLPFYKDCFISFIVEEQILKIARNIIEVNFQTLKFNFKKVENKDKNNLLNSNIILIKETQKLIFADINIRGEHFEIKKYCEQNKKGEIEKYYIVEIFSE